MAKKKIPDKEVRKVAEQVASRKGMPWSETEFRATAAMAKSDLMRLGATETQIDRFDEFIEAAPIRGGRFK